MIQLGSISFQSSYTQHKLLTHLGLKKACFQKFLKHLLSISNFVYYSFEYCFFFIYVPEEISTRPLLYFLQFDYALDHIVINYSYNLRTGKGFNILS